MAIFLLPCLLSKYSKFVLMLLCMTSSVLMMPGRWKLLLLRLLSGCFLTWICLACLAKKQDSQQQLNISTRKPSFSILLDHRKSIVREQCNKLEQQGNLRSSYIVPENSHSEKVPTLKLNYIT